MSSTLSAAPNDVIPVDLSSATSSDVTDTLVALQPVSASEQPTSITVVPAFNSDSGEANPFSDVMIDDPNPGQLESATIAVSGPAPGTLTAPPLQDLTAANLAAALDQVVFSIEGEGAGTDAVTATITDTAGQTTTLTTTAAIEFLQPIQVVSFVPAITSAAETSSSAQQTITGSLDEFVALYNQAGGDRAIVEPFGGGTVTLEDNGTAVGTAVTDSSGAFSATVTLATDGANSVTAVYDNAVYGTFVSAPVVDTLTAPSNATTTIGTGSSTLALFVSERAAPAGAAFTVDVDGVQVGGVQTTSADSTAGQMQQFDVLGNFAAGSNTVTINDLNASNSLLTVENATIDGVAVAGSALTLANDGSAGFSFVAIGGQTPVVIGSGRDTLALTLSERAQPGAAFTLSVDGTPISGPFTTSADILQGQSQVFDVMGNFAAGPNTVLIDYGSAANSLLLVDNATIDGTAIANSALSLANVGAATIGFTAPGPAAPLSAGTGPDTLALTLSERGQPTGAAFTVDVNGQQIGGVQTTTADSTTGQSQVIDLLGQFAAQTNAVSIDYLNASASILTVQGAAIDGTAIAGSALSLSNIGMAGFTFQGPGTATPGATIIGSGPDTLELTASQRAAPAGAQFTVAVDGTQIGGVQTVTADATKGQAQLFDVLGDFGAAANTVSIAFLNPANSLLTIQSATIDGAPIGAGSLVLSNVGASSFMVPAPVHGG